MFGSIYTTDPQIKTLAELGQEQLYPKSDFDMKTELKKLNHSLLLNFCLLVRDLIKDPTSWQERTSFIRTILVNMHHIINSYRPHQAREILILMMENQVKRRRSVTESLKNACAEIEKGLKDVKVLLDEKLREIDAMPVDEDVEMDHVGEEQSTEMQKLLEIGRKIWNE